jgi:uncharacterized repeat protein (TIGR02543 family)
MFSVRKKIIYGSVLILIAALTLWGCSPPTSSSPDAAWTAQADGDGAAASTKIDFVFDRAVSGLTADDIVVTDGTGRVAKGELTGSGSEWSLGITALAAGEVTVAINKSGINGEAKAVTVRTAPAVAWSALANGVDGTEDSTAIVFTFATAIAGLTADDIAIAESTGSVTKGELTGSGSEWSLGVAVLSAGDVTVSITKAGVASTARNVAVYKAGQSTALTWTAQADGVSGANDSTIIVFTFSGAVTGLSADDISIVDKTGNVEKGAISGSGNEWGLGIAVLSAGDVTVSINKDGIEAAERDVAVYKAGQESLVSWKALANGAEDATDSTAIVFSFSGEVAGLTADNITIANGAGAAVKGALTGSGTNWSLGITVSAAGDVKVKIAKAGVDGAEQAVTVHKASAPASDIAYDAAADGGAATSSSKIDFTFAAAVTGLTADNITVVNGTGAAVKGALTGSGTNWSLGITVSAAGDVKVKIAKAGIEAGEKTVAVHKAAPPEEGDDIAFDAAADGGAATSSSKINFTFAAAVTGLTADNITVVNGTGDVVKGALTGEGVSWSLGITVNAAGTVKVKINKAGIDAAEKTVTAHKAPVPGDIAYTVAADGGATASSTKIDFVFTAAVAGLAAGDITVSNGTGAAVKGALTGSGTTWSLGITVNTAGTVKVKINKAGIDAAEKTVTAHKVDITYDATADGGGSTTSTKIDFTFSAAVTGLTADTITVSNGTGAAVKGALTGSGTSWSLGITVSVAGTVKVKINKAGIEAAEKTVTAHKAPPPEEGKDIAFDVTADGGAATTSSKINFTFAAAVTGLSADNITVSNDTGAAVKGALTGSGTSWSLGITVNTAGNVKVKIAKAGIEAAEKTVTVHKAPTPVSDITYTTTADGGATAGSTKIDFTFSAAVTGLTADTITISNDTGAAVKGALTGSGTTWSLGITVNTAGNVKVKIAKAGIEAAEKTVTVHKAPTPVSDITYTATADGGATAGSTKIDFAFSSAVAGLTADTITVSNGTGAAVKGALTGSGTSWSLGITVSAAGDVKVKIAKAGIEAAEKTVTVYKAPTPVSDITYTATADGGATAGSTKIDFAFSFAVAGLTADTITIANDTGATVKGALTGSGTTWSLGITVNTAGNVKVKIAKAGIEAAEKTVTVHKVFVVSFDAQGGSPAPGQQTVASGGMAAAPNPAPTKAGHTLDGWYAAYTTRWEFATSTVTANVTLYAKWTPITYTVSFNAQGGSPAPGQQTVASGGKAATPSPAPAKAGYTLDGWYTEAAYTTRWDFAARTVTTDVTLHAKWTLITYTVSFDVQGGSPAPGQQTVASGGMAAAPDPAPAKAGHTLDGWYTEAAYTTRWDFSSTVTANVTLHAKWTAVAQYVPEVGFEDGAPLRVKDVNNVVISSGDPAKTVTGTAYHIDLMDASEYAGIAWYINGTKSTVTGQRLALDITRKGRVMVTVETHTADGVYNTGSFTFDIQ